MAVVIILGVGAFFLLCVLSKTLEPLNLRPYEDCHPIKEINATTPCSQTKISTPRPIFVDLNLAKMCNEMCQKLVQSLNFPFFPPTIGAETGRAKRESRITCMRMLRTSQSKITRSQPRCSRQCVSFSARALKKKHFLWRWYCNCGKKHKNVKIEIWWLWSVLLSTTSTRLYSFQKHIFGIVSACSASLQKFLKGKSDVYK